MDTKVDLSNAANLRGKIHVHHCHSKTLILPSLDDYAALVISSPENIIESDQVELAFSPYSKAAICWINLNTCVVYLHDPASAALAIKDFSKDLDGEEGETAFEFEVCTLAEYETRQTNRKRKRE